MANLIVHKVVVSDFLTNCYICYNDETMEAFIVDPGDHAPRIEDAVSSLGVKPVLIVLTHGHIDHMEAALIIKERYGIEILAHEAEQAVLADPHMNLSDIFCKQPLTFQADRVVTHQQKLNLVGFEATILHTPGHTPGSMCIYFEKEHILLSGDTLFYESVGRTDFPGGDRDTIIISILKNLIGLPDEVKVYSGHFEDTDIFNERQYNPVVYYKAWLKRGI